MSTTTISSSIDTLSQSIESFRQLLLDRFTIPLTTINRSPAPEHVRIFNPNFEYSFIFSMAILLFFMRRIISRYVLSPLATRWNVPKHERQRFIENGWFSLYYPFMVIFAVVAMWDTPWFSDWRAIYYDFPEGHLADVKNFPLLRKYCLFAMAFYSQALFGLLYVDERMKDFGEMLTHHIATILVMALSMSMGMHRIGSIVVLLHDVGDVFLYNAKFFHVGGFQTLANVLFFLFTVTFFVTRLVIFPMIPFYVPLGQYYQQYLEYGVKYIVGVIPNISSNFEFSLFGICVRGYCFSSIYLMGICLFCLLFLHMYWFTLIVKLLIKTLKDGGDVKGDPRVINNGKNKGQDDDTEQQQEETEVEKRVEEKTVSKSMARSNEFMEKNGAVVKQLAVGLKREVHEIAKKQQQQQQMEDARTNFKAEVSDDDSVIVRSDNDDDDEQQLSDDAATIRKRTNNQL